MKNLIRFRPLAAHYWSKFLALLRVKTPIGGLEISDAVLRLVYFDDRAWRMGGIRLEPGVMEGGKIKNRDKFVEALKTLKTKVFGEHHAERVSVVASLSSISIYSQVFSLPIIEGENLEKAIQLNVQMVSPVDAAQAYSGWQFVGRDQDALRLEILSAFIEKQTVDDINKALFEAGFLVVAMESRALALSRLFREQGEGIDASRSYVMVSVDSSGIDFLIIRRGQLYFEYFNPWRDIMNEHGIVSMEAYRATILRSLHQVLNFYGQHWKDQVVEVFVSAVAMMDETEAIIRENFSLPTKRFRLALGESISPNWYIAVGCGLRGLVPRSSDKELSLLGIGAEEGFRREQMVSFLRLWRLAIPVSLGILAVLFLLADLFAIQTGRSLGASALLELSDEQASENKALLAEAEEFNRNIAMIRSVQDNAFSKGRLLEKINSLALLSGVFVVELNFSSPDQPISFRGRSDSQDKVLNYKKALEGDPQFREVDLPLAGIVSEEGAVSFSMTFRIN